jgi:GNAT superfamily N-acetyltransferase
MSSSARVRPARREDIVPLVEMLGREFVPVAPDGRNFDPALSVAVMDGLPMIYLGVVGAEIVGCLGLRHSALWWSGTPYVCDQPFFVAERARASRLASDLLAAGERYAAKRGWPLIINVSSGVDVERKALWFNRKGFRTLGGMYAKGL